MRELERDEQDSIIQVLLEGRFDRALGILAVWGSDHISNGHAGHSRERAWKLSAAESSAAEKLGPDDFAPDQLDYWRGAGTLHLLTQLEIRLHGDWQAAHRSLIRIALPDSRTAWLVRKHALPATRSDRLVGIARHLRYFHVIAARLGDSHSGYVLEVNSIDPILDNRLAQARKASRGFIGHFAAGITIDWQHPVPGYVHAAGLKDAPNHQQACLALLSSAAGTTFFVLPECCVPTSMRRAIAAAIGRMGRTAPLLSVPGSFHDASDGNPPFANCCEIVDNRGCAVVTHAKTAVAAGPDETGTMIDEYIQPHDRLHVLATSIGLVGVAICLEFSHPSGTSVAAWSAVAPEWMMVPSMGNQSTLDLHRGVANHLFKTHRTVTLVANQPATGAGHPGFIVPTEKSNESQVNCVVNLPKASNIK